MIESSRDVQCGGAEIIGATHIELVVIGAGSWATKFDVKACRAGKKEIAAGKNARARARRQVSLARDVPDSPRACQGPRGGADHDRTLRLITVDNYAPDAIDTSLAGIRIGAG